MSSARAAAAALATVIAVLLLTCLPAEASGGRSRQQAASIELVDQTPSVARGERWNIEVRTSGVPADAFLQLIVYPSISTPEQFAATVDGADLGVAIFTVSPQPMSSFPAGSGGGRTLSLFLEPLSAPLQISLTQSRTYPVEVRASNAAGETLASLITYIIVQPDEGSGSEPLRVAVVGDLRTDPVRQPDGTALVDPTELAQISAAAEALGETDAPASLALTPELADALAGDPRPEALTALQELRALARGRAVLARPYTEVSAQALADAELSDQLATHLARGAGVVRAELGVEPVPGTWLPETGLGALGLDVLAREGVTNLLVASESLGDSDESDGDDDAAEEPTVPFAVQPPGGNGDQRLTGMAIDDDLAQLLAADEEPILVAQRVAAALAVLWWQAPESPRAAVLLVDLTEQPEVAARLLDQLAAPGMLLSSTLPDVFGLGTTTDGSNEPPVRQLAPAAAEPIGAAVANDLRRAQQDLVGYAAMVGAESPRPDPLAKQLLVATADGFSGEQRRAHIDAVHTEIGNTVGAVGLPVDPQVTLTSRTGTVPLTITRSTDFPVTVQVQLESTRLEFPDGETLTVPLEEETTRLDVEVETLSSGSFPLDVELVSPDGSLPVTETRYRVRSTAVSGVGLIISIGAGVFLAVWWGSHWHRARRSRRLMPRHAAGRTQPRPGTRLST